MQGTRFWAACLYAAGALSFVTGCQPATQPAPVAKADDLAKKPDENSAPKAPEAPADDSAQGLLARAAKHLAQGEAEPAQKLLDGLNARKAELSVIELVEFDRLRAWASDPEAVKKGAVDAAAAEAAKNGSPTTPPVAQTPPPVQPPLPTPAPPPPEPKESPALVEARKLVEAEKWDEAAAQLDKLLAKADDAATQRDATALRQQVERQQTRLRELR